MKFFIFILVYLKDLRVISPDVLSTTTYGYQTAIAFGLNSSGGHRGANDLVSKNFRHVTGHHSSVRNQNLGRPGHRSHWRPNCPKWYSMTEFMTNSRATMTQSRLSFSLTWPAATVTPKTSD